MKQHLCLVLALVCVLFCGCSSNSHDIAIPENYYYIGDPVVSSSEQGIIVAEIRETVQFADADTLKPLLDDYLSGPNAMNYKSPFPKNTELRDIRFAEHTATVVLSEEFAKLSGIDLSVACACLSKTLMELTGVNTVTISVLGASLDGKESLTMYAEHLHFHLPEAETEPK